MCGVLPFALSFARATSSDQLSDIEPLWSVPRSIEYVRQGYAAYSPCQRVPIPYALQLNALKCFAYELILVFTLLYLVI